MVPTKCLYWTWYLNDMTVLRGELAIRQSRALIRTIKQMKDCIIENQYFIGTK